MGPTTEMVEPPAQFAYARGYEQMDYEQPMFLVPISEEIIMLIVHLPIAPGILKLGWWFHHF